MIKKHTKIYFDQINQILSQIPVKDIEKTVEVIHQAYLKNKHIFIMGNGGSAATASHFACDLGKGTLPPQYDKKIIKRFKVTSLTDNVAVMTAWGNDANYDQIFVQQLENLLKKGDVVIGISASGNSPNVIKAIELAKKRKAIAIGLAGFDGGKLAKITDVNITAKIDRYDVAEDIHLILTHLITRHFFEKINIK